MAAQHVIIWDGDKVAARAKKAAFYGALKAAYFLRAYIRNMIGVAGYGISSEPGTPPHLQTGELRDSIKVLSANMLDEVIVYTDNEYWSYLEYGTDDGRVAARPFWRRSISETRLALGKLAQVEMLRYMQTGARSGGSETFGQHFDYATSN